MGSALAFNLGETLHRRSVVPDGTERLLAREPQSVFGPGNVPGLVYTEASVRSD